MEDTSNWLPNTVPGSSDVAVFDSESRGVSTNPTENTSTFSISALSFPHRASPFTFTFNNQRLAFSGLGITGNQTNPTLLLINTNNAVFLGDMLSFASSGTSGSANITCSNSASLTGAVSGQSIGFISSHVHAAGGYTISDQGTITATNTGFDSTSGPGGNSTAVVAGSQLQFDDSFTSSYDVAIDVENSGTYDGSNSGAGEFVGVVQGHQIFSAGAFEADDNFSCTVENSGHSNGAGIGACQIGVINASQIGLQSTGRVGNGASITISNTGTNSSFSSSIFNEIAYLNDNQLFVGEAFQAGDRFHLTVSNTGNDNSAGLGQNQVAVINSNSGTSGDQVLFRQGATFENDAVVNVTNSGTYNGINTGGGSQVAGMNLGQFTVGDNTAVGSYQFSAGERFSLSVANAGTDSALGIGGDVVGTVSTNQVTFYTPSSLGNKANINISNSGHYTGSASTNYVNVGSTGSSQFLAASTFAAGDDFTLDIINFGTNASTGIGNHFIGDIINGQQAGFVDGFTLGNNGSINIANTATNSASTSNHNQVGCLLGYGVQFLVKEEFLAGDNLHLTIANTGVDNSTGSGGNLVGFFNNNTASFSASQFHLANGGSVGNKASFTLSNSGTFGGNNSGSNAIAILGGPQFASVDAFTAGNHFSLDASMVGTNNASGQNGNSIGLAGGPQVAFVDDCTVGDAASFAISNRGINYDASGTNHYIGYVSGAQMNTAGHFIAGAGLDIQILNSGLNEGDASNFVGHVVNSQLSFQQACTLGEGASINVINEGTVGGSQIYFGQGFDIPSGKATIQIANAGEITDYGIEIHGSNGGGNAEIVMSNSSLFVATSLPDFTIAGLSGDETCTALSLPTLVIDRDSTRETEFAGVILNFSGINPTSLVKTGAGTQVLSGANTYTGMTTVEEGILVVNGSIGGDALVTSDGILKGSGTINGTLTNIGTIAPGQSIGTTTVGSYINNGGTYEAEVNGAGQSDLIHSLGTATINGGTVVVSSVDGAYKFNTPYTIVTADTSLTGTFSNATSAAFISSALTYDANNVFLTISPALSNAAVKCNQKGVASKIDTLPSMSDAQTVLISTIANLPLADAQKALESLSGFQYTNEVWATEISTGQFLRRLYDPLRPLVASCGDVPCEEFTAWLETGFGYYNLQGGNAHSTHAYSYQLTGGVQRQLASDLFLGIAGSYEYDHEKFTAGKARRNTGYVALYGLYRPDCFYALCDLAYGYTSTRLNRKIEAGDLSYRACGHPDVNTLALYTEVGMDFGVHCLLLQPFIGLQIGKNWRSKVKESEGSGWGLVINEYQWTPVNSRIGLHLDASNLCSCVDAYFDIAWDQRLSSNGNSTKGRFKEFGGSYGICGNKLDDASVDYALTLTRCFCDNIQVFVEFEGLWSAHANTNGVSAMVEYSW